MKLTGQRVVQRFGVEGEGIWQDEEGVWNFEDTTRYVCSPEIERETPDQIGDGAVKFDSGATVRWAQFYCPAFTRRPDGTVGQHVIRVATFVDGVLKSQKWTPRPNCYACKSIMRRVAAGESPDQ